MIDSAGVVDILRESIYVGIKMSAPMLGVALIIGVVVSLFQALTQIQEMTLTFIPKIIGLFVVLIITLPFMIRTLIGFTEQLYSRMALG